MEYPKSQKKKRLQIEWKGIKKKWQDRTANQFHKRKAKNLLKEKSLPNPQASVNGSGNFSSRASSSRTKRNPLTEMADKATTTTAAGQTCLAVLHTEALFDTLKAFYI